MVTAAAADDWLLGETWTAALASSGLFGVSARSDATLELGLGDTGAGIRFIWGGGGLRRKTTARGGTSTDSFGDRVSVLDTSWGRRC